MSDFNLSLNDRIALTVANIYGFNRRSVTVERSGVIYAGSEYCGEIRGEKIIFDRQGFDRHVFGMGINPVVKRTNLDRYPGWTIREYSDGMFDASNGRALSPGYETFADAVGFARRDGASA